MSLLGSITNGFVIGLAVAAPVGPIGVLCIRRTLAEGRLAGFVSGLGAAAADAVYGLIAALGLASIVNLLVSAKPVLQFAGGLFLFYLAWTIARASPVAAGADKGLGGSLPRQFGGVFLLTLANPATILSFIGIFAGAGLSLGSDSFAEAGAMVAGVFLGSAAWWLTLSLGVGLFRTRIGPGWMRAINLGAAAILAGFALLAIGQLLLGWALRNG